MKIFTGSDWALLWGDSEQACARSHANQWCREMVEQASHDGGTIEARLIIARGKRLVRQSPEVTRALDKEIAMLQRIREELERDIETWIA